MVDIDPDDAAAQAMSQYDSNQDGKLTDDELRAVPGILKWKKLYDSNDDDVVSEEEIVARLEKWQSDQLAFRRQRQDRSQRPSGEGRGGDFTPESYLGPEVKPARGVTNRRGYPTRTREA